ncbi:MAG: L,D-transpeptidase family protein [Victivallaceae bacterium]
MHKQSYNLDYDHTKASDGSKWPRTIAIFVVIALVTAGIIYLVVPKSEKTADAARNGSETTGVTPPPETITPATETATAKPTAPTAKAGNDTVIDETEKANAPKTEVEVTSPVTAEPVKGKPHPSDPPHDEPVIAPDGIEPGFVKTESAKVEAKLKAGQYTQARDAAKALLKQLTSDSQQYRDVAKLLTLANVKLYFSAGAGGSDEFYKVQTGDTLFKIARKHNTTVDALLKLNNLKSADLIKVNQKIRIGNPNWQLEINKESRLLKVYAAQELFAVYDIGIGRLGRTPAGKFTIGEKIENPDYRAPEGKMIRAGEPGNELGSRWMRLVAAPGSAAAPEGYGIHGTPHEESVSRSLSNGCIRMRNREVEELFLIVPAGTPVEIN